MATVLVIAYAFYFVLVGFQGNAPAFLAQVSTEKQFLYWLVILVAVAALWGTGSTFGRLFAALIVVGFLVSGGGQNTRQIVANAQAILPGLGGGGLGSSTPAGATGAAGGVT